MSLFSTMMCALGRHYPRRREVEWDGKTYRGQCRHCGSEVVRVSRKTWRKARDRD
ncbi:MAG: hypothetical protein ACK4IS_08730 [Erythrobacter sp.]